MRPRHRALLRTSALVALATACGQVHAQAVQSTSPGAGPADAQAGPVAPPAATGEPGTQGQPASNNGDEIVVTGSRVAISGFTAPTPTKVLSSEQLTNRGLANVGDFLNEVPAFRPSQSTNSNPQNSYGAGQSFADLRGLGSIRTLTLVDGRRFVPSSSTGQVDLNLVPTILVSRVDVVTGGASAVYGSDAISGVVNVILDKRLRGFKTDLSFGVSTYGDNAEKRASLAFGTPFSGDRGHFVIGGEYVQSNGVLSFFDRDWGRLQGELVSYTGTRPADAPSRFYSPGVTPINFSPGGLILGVNADTNAANGVDVLRGIEFGPGGVIRPFTYGTVIGTSAINFTGGTPNFSQRIGMALVLPLKRRTVMAHLDYDLTDNISFFVEGSYARSAGYVPSPPVRDTTATALVIRRDNAFLPAAIATIMDANKITSFGLGRISVDFGDQTSVSQNTTDRLVAGLNGSLGGGWKWDVYYETGHNTYDLTYNHLRIEQNFQYAADSIIVNGQAVCRDTTARALGCVPINLFGQGSPSQASVNYVTGLAFFRAESSEQVLSGTLRGTPLSTWAGPVSIAVGAEHRRESTIATADPISNAGGFNYGNARAFSGEYKVREAFGEIEIPLARDVPLLRRLDFNGAVRYTDYSTTGGVTTWKLGATWEPVAGILVRGTRSRDIRAPNNSELFSFVTTRTTLINAFSGTTEILTAFSTSSPSLQPEKADTKTIGLVLSPRFIPGLNISADYYDINIDGAIAGITPQTIIDRCFAEVSSGTPGFYCTFVNRTGTGSSTVINSVSAQLLNLAQLKTNGIDFDASYRFPLAGGQLTARMSGNYTAHLITNDGLGIPRSYNAAGVITTVGSIVDRAGQLGGFFSGANNGATAVPHWSLNGSLTYSIGRFTATAQGRWFEGGAIDKALVGPDSPDYQPASAISIGNNHVDGAFYLNLSAAIDVLKQGTRKVQLYGVVSNVTNRDPSFPATAVSSLFDKVGRYFKVGVRSNF